jgi:hypothetical protein
MRVLDVNTAEENPGSGSALDRRRMYVVPSLSRYGTLADLTRKTGTKNLNDGSGGGCGNMNHAQSCLHP